MNRNQNGSGSRKPSGTRTRPLTREEAILAEKRRAEERRRRRETKKLVEKGVAIGIFALIAAAICLIIMFAYIFIDFRSVEKTPDQPVKVTYQKNDTVVLNDEYFDHRNGEYYVSLAKVSELCSFTLHGNSKNMTLTLPDGKSASFDTGTPSVKVGSVYSVLKNKTYFSGGHLFIPVSFFEDMCKGIRCEYDKLGKVKGLNLIFEKDFTFKVLKNEESEAIIYNAPSDSSEKSMFKSDLSDYESYMNPENADEFIALINSSHKLKKDYVPEDLFQISDTIEGLSGEKLRLNAAKALEAMFIEMRAHGFSGVGAVCGYRSYDYQKSLLDNETNALFLQYGDKKKAEELAGSRVFAPGESEHQSGLGVDICNSTLLTEAFSETAEYKWLYSNCADFGFILRYPKDKSDITGKEFMPWHFRYVGRSHAKKIMDEGLCLEEYLEIIG
ncbi:MAG: M15 family metallopeptidase [Clostridia bacterium]|nr:M15 family metallopeptidase [Clostridia bacterium]